MDTLLEQIGILLYAVITAALTAVIAYVKRRLNIKKADSLKDINNIIKLDRNIIKKLIEIRVKYDANKVCIYQFHNGDYYISNHSAMKFSLTHEDTDAKTVSYINESQELLTSHYSDFLNSLLSRDYLIIINENGTSDIDVKSFKDIMRHRLEKSVICIGLKDRNNRAIGFIKLVYNDIIINIDDVKLKVLFNYIKDLEFMLSTNPTKKIK